MLIIGLTGGIGSGKSTVAHYFEQLGIPVIDADMIAHRLVEPGKPALTAIVDRFGRSILNPDGSLNRRQLRQLIFSNDKGRKDLEAILHPLIRKVIKHEVANLNTPYCILSIPLLLESGWSNEVDRVLIVDLPPELQLKRAAERDQVSKENIQAIINSQVDRQTRLASADDIITNTGDLSALHAQIDHLHQQYLSLAENDYSS